MFKHLNRRYKNLAKHAPFVIMGLAVLFFVLALFGDDSYMRLRALRVELDAQRLENAHTREYLKSLKHDVVGIQQNDRILEKAARNNLGMQRADEITIIFDE